MKSSKKNKTRWWRLGFIAVVVVCVFAMLAVTADAKGLSAAQIKQRLQKYRGASLTIASWGGSYQAAQRKAYFEPFSKEFGIKIIEDSPAVNSKIMAMVKAGNVTWDVVDVGSYKADNLGVLGYLEPIDYSIVDATDVIPMYVSKWHIGTIAWCETMGYRTDVFPEGNAPTTCMDFFDVKRFPGRRAMRDNPIFNIPLALAADGVPFDQIYPLTEAKIQRAFKKLDQIRPHVNVWWTQGAQPAQLLTDKEVVIATGWNGRLSASAKEGAPIKVLWAGGQLVGDSWIVPKGAKQKELSMLFIAWATLPENNWRLSTYIDYAPVNKKAFPLVPAKYREYLPIDHVDQMIKCDFQWWEPNYSKMVERWREWKLQ